MKAHACVVCAALPPDQRPPRPRPADTYGRKRLKRCASHEREVVALARAARHATYVTKTYGIDVDEQMALWEYQGRRCACGRQPSRMPDTDHDHVLAATHDHPTDTACPGCMRGLLCRYCNTKILGMGYTADMLAALADYLRNPPYQEMRSQRGAA